MCDLGGRELRVGAQLEDFWKWPAPVERWKMRERELLAGKREQEESGVSAAALEG